MAATDFMPPDFMTQSEKALGDRLLEKGYVIVPAEDRSSLDRIQAHVAAAAAAHLGVAAANNPLQFLDGVHDKVSVEKLNALRLAVIDGLAAPWVRPAYFATARRSLETLVGNELAMQRRINLSIQLPNDDSSLLPVHSDVWAGDSPYEVVLWIPLVDCRATKSMYIASADATRDVHANHGKYRNAEDIFRAIEGRVEFLDIPYGHVLLFTQNLMHGNRVNREKTTRWSMNCRFKSVLSPYADKKLGEFFEPITLRAATRLGMNYTLPGGGRG